MSRSQDRKDAAKRLGVVLQGEYKLLAMAVGEEAIQVAAMKLGETFNSNIEFICWVLKEYGGVEQIPFQPVTKKTS